MIKVLKDFYDLKEGQYRSVGSEFEATKERFYEINEALPDFVEWSEKHTEVIIPDVPSY